VKNRRLSGSIESRYCGRHSTAHEMARLRALLADPPLRNHHTMPEEF